MLSAIRVVLLNTSHPGNIGASARAMKTMGLSALWLAKPKHFPDAEATARASGADDVLSNAAVCTSIDEAVSECRLVIGASARARNITCPLLAPRGCAQLVRQESEQGKVAIVFGNEQSGLSNTEIDRCHYLVQIPTHSGYSSLNLAAAVQVLAYEIFLAHLEELVLPEAGEMQSLPVSTGEMERFYVHLEQTLVELAFLDPKNPRQLMRRLRRLYNRARPDENEMNILRGILTAARQGKE